jgi:hypothetical protein
VTTFTLMRVVRTLLLVCMVTSGCAHQMRVESDPPGARVIVDGEDVGVTPVTVTEPILAANPHSGVEIVSGPEHLKLGVTRVFRIDAAQVGASAGLATFGVAVIVVPVVWLNDGFGPVDDTFKLVAAPFIVITSYLAAYLLPFSCAPLVIGEPEGPDVLHVDVARRRVTTTPHAEVVIHDADSPPAMLH